MCPGSNKQGDRDHCVTLKLYVNDLIGIYNLTWLGSVYLRRFQFGLPRIGNHSQFLATFLQWLEPPVTIA